MFKVNNGNTRTVCKICSKLAIKALEQRHWRRSIVFNINFKRFHALLWYFLCWHWRNKYRLVKLKTFTSVLLSLHKKWSFPLRISSVFPQISADLVQLATEEIFNEKLYFLCIDFLLYYQSFESSCFWSNSECLAREKCLYSEFVWSVFSRILREYGEIQSECGRMRTRKTPNTDSFHAVLLRWISSKLEDF